MELMKKMTRLSEPEAAFLMHQILVAVHYMHDNLVIHRDLKLGNLFLTEHMEIKIGDFGLAAQLDYPEQRKQTLCGTPNYIAPEILRSSGHSYEVDVWSIGVIMYTLLVGTPPFETTNVKETYKNIKENNYSFPSEPRISEVAKDLIKSILVPDPSKRPTVSQILSHRFFTIHANAVQHCPHSLLQYAALYSGTPSTSKGVTGPVQPVTRVPFKPINPNLIEQVKSPAKVLASPSKPISSLMRRPVVSAKRSPPQTQRTQAPPAQPQFRPSQALEPQVPVPRLSPMPVVERAERVSPLGTARSTRTSPGDRKEASPLFSVQQYSNSPATQPSPPVSAPSVQPSPTVETVVTRSVDDDEERNNLTTMHENLTQSFVAIQKTTRERPVLEHSAPKRARTPSSTSPSTMANRSSPPTKVSPRRVVVDLKDEDGDIDIANNHSPMQQTNVWVCQHADFSNKYGLAYRLNSGMTGAHFNDSSKMIWNHETGQIDYIERKRNSSNSAAFDEKQSFNIENFPPELQKKITLIKHFRVYLDKEKETQKLREEPKPITWDTDVYVKRWLKTRHAVIFRLSNKVVQVHFQDDTEIILSSEARLVTYTDTRGERRTFPLNDLVNNPQAEVSKRLKYTKDILYQLISKQSSK
jgi:polo-like kinase 1